ncbi:deoxyribonuclease IV [Halodesulfovibrio marinisediminis]|uniref:Probable endonuclease 4 n=1 Tax=Halodesulfovibrio marinisediminis DSM 17456 TaxID=1121457 RepID=A0A1N6DJS9_9BACT|nr:deoxyribonuclease IV [Halodesulfovibrio marinisediminis]SIN71020.1 Endonuclease IV [Halodesulfovibrio marinisediminis DSM 17456]
MRYFGAHMSIAGGLDKAIERIMRVNGTALQIFSKNQRQWKSKPLEQKQIDAFIGACKDWGDYPIAAHDSYLINLGSPKEEGVEKSVAAFSHELERAEQLNIPYVVMHPGAHLGSNVDEALERVAKNLDRAFYDSRTERVMVLLENTAGQGTTLGRSFDELAVVIQHSRNADRLGVCVDTCHAYAAGYDLTTDEGYAATFAEFESTVGLSRLKFMHVNDSKGALGSHLDRHDHIGHGLLGEETFARIVNDPRFIDLPMVLETPKGEDLAEDVENLNKLYGLIIAQV